MSKPQLGRGVIRQMPLGDVERAFNYGMVSERDWTWYRCLWRNSVARYSDECSEHEGHAVLCCAEQEPPHDPR